MTINSYDNRRTFPGNGATVAFSFPPPFTVNTDLVVQIQAADGTITTKTLGSDYTVSSPPYTSGGTVTMTVAPATGTTLIIYRDVPITQGVATQDGGPLPAATINGALDRITMWGQRLKEELEDAIPELEGFADAAEASATAAAASQSAAASSQSAAAASATAAAASVTTAASSATASANSAIDSATSALTAGELASQASDSATAAAQSAATTPIIWRGAWVTSRAYSIKDAVSDNGSSYICILAHTSGATTEPGVGANQGTYWNLMAQKGATGAGSGNVNGPASSLTGHMAIFTDTSGTNLGDGGVPFDGTYSSLSGKPTLGTSAAKDFNTAGGVQAYDPMLAALAGLITVADRGLYFTGADAPAQFTLTSFARTILDDADASTVRTTISAETLGEQAGINTQTGSTYTLVLTDKGKVVEMNNASSNTLTIPPNSSVAFPTNSRIDLVQLGVGQTTIAAGAGVTIRSSGSKLKLTGQYSGATLYKRGTDEWVLVGDLSS